MNLKNNMNKNILIFTGALFLGFGIGTVVLGEIELKPIFITLITSGSLVLGGFFLAIGITSKVKKEEKIEEEKVKEEKIDEPIKKESSDDNREEKL